LTAGKHSAWRSGGMGVRIILVGIFKNQIEYGIGFVRL
jgi:hypothetical protein